ncbi:MAG: c-type cytochrome [Ktedonobacterales bacterium]
MGRTSNPGWLAVTVSVALAILFILLSATNVLNDGLGYKLAAVVVVVAALIYIFYARGNSVEKSGYGSLVFIIAVALIIPALLITQQQQQVAATQTQYITTLQDGAALYGQYCASCHGFQGQGLNAPQLNNSPAVAKFTTDQITNIIAGGIPSDPSNPTVLSMPNWSNRFGGPLTDDDINYLVTLIQSSNPAYRKLNNLADVNGFSYVLGTLTDPTQIAEYKLQKEAGGVPTNLIDLTSEASVQIQAINSAPGAAFTYGWVAKGYTTANIKIKVGTTVTWSNISATIHNVYQGTPSDITNKFPQSGLVQPGVPSSDYTYTFKKAGDYPFFCDIHPAMIGYIEVVAS